MHGLEQRWSGAVDFVYLDIDDPNTDAFKRQLGFGYQPHFFLLDGEGDVVEQWVGAVSREELDSALTAVTQ